MYTEIILTKAPILKKPNTTSDYKKYVMKKTFLFAFMSWMKRKCRGINFDSSPFR